MVRVVFPQSDLQRWPEVTCQHLRIITTFHTPRSGIACSFKVAFYLPANCGPSSVYLFLHTTTHLPDDLTSSPPRNCISIDISPFGAVPLSSVSHQAQFWSPLSWNLPISPFGSLSLCLFFPSDSISISSSLPVATFAPLSVSPRRLPVSVFLPCLGFLFLGSS